MIDLTDRIRAVTVEGILTGAEQIEYIDASGNTSNIKATLDSIGSKLDIILNNMDLESTFAYGIQWDKTSTSPDCTRVGNMLLHSMLPIQSQMRGCLLDDDGNVIKYLPDSGWTEETLDGSAGQVMVEIPKFYWKFSESGNTQTVMLSQVAIDGYKKVEKSYVSAYEATIDRQDSNKLKLASVKSDNVRYRGCNNTAANDGTYQTGLRRPVTSLTLTNARTYARNRKDGSYNWNVGYYQQHKAIFWLFAVEYATRNTQKAVNTETAVNGFKQGGLGNGVTTVSDGAWNAFNGRYPFVPIGTTDGLGNGSGEVEYISYSGEGESWVTVKVPRYRGIENPFGHIWKTLDGIKILVESGETGNSSVYICNDFSLWNDRSDTEGYIYMCDEDRAGGYIKEIVFGENGDIIAKTTGGGSTTYYCDNHYVNTTSATVYRALRVGGTSSYGVTSGLVCSSSSRAPSNSYTNFGFRLSFIPTII